MTAGGEVRARVDAHSVRLSVRSGGSPRWAQAWLPAETAGAPDDAVMRWGADTVNQIGGGTGPRWRQPVSAVVQDWATTLGCTHVVAEKREHAVHHRWQRADGSSPIRYLEITEGGHAWPGAQDGEHARVFGHPSAMDATGTAAAFFRECVGAGGEDAGRDDRYTLSRRS